NYPNPFNPNTTIFFETTNSHENARIEIYNLKGQKVQEFDVILNDVEGESNSITWNGTDSNNQSVSSGIYFYQLKVDGKSIAKNRCLLLK
ncbi:MAG: T9SS type A sorting domain-containing protein, partial [Candidatus Cloacimonetes bacterium]|nr:T9SS type A sorting domain-containing protein [Candidatus Cloacimonadota bacterium]